MLFSLLTPEPKNRPRPPRVELTYDVTVDGAVVKQQLPFVVGVLADLSGIPDEPLPPLADRKFVAIDWDNFESVMEAARPALKFKVENRLTDEGSRLALDLRFRSVYDFEPASVARQVAPLKRLIELRSNLAALIEWFTGNERLQETLRALCEDQASLDRIAFDLAHREPYTTPPALQQLLDGLGVSDPAAVYQRVEMLAAFFEIAVSGSFTNSYDLRQSIQIRIADIDALVSNQLRAILHHPEFQKLEATWRGLYYLVQQTPTGPTLKIRVLNATKRELLRDAQTAVEFDRHALFQKVHDQEFGLFGGEPYSILVADYYFGRQPEDIALLEKLSRVAEVAHAPLLSAAAPELFDLNSFADLPHPRDLAKVFERPEYAMWMSFRYSEASRYVALVVPHILLRAPYGSSTVPVKEFNFEEGVDGYHHDDYLWGNAAYALAARITGAFARYGWTAAIRGVEGGGVVSGLPVHVFKTADGDIELKCPTEIPITDRLEKELADQGFLPLVHCKGRDYACFFSAQTTQKAKLYDVASVTAASKAAAQLPFVLAVARIAHYLKAIIRDKIAGFPSREECERYLQTWIAQYVTEDDQPTQATRARYPLRSAEVQVTDVGGGAGYLVTVYLLPNFQLGGLQTPLMVRMDLPQARW